MYMKKWFIVTIILIVLALPLMWYLASPLFFDKVVDESMPSGEESIVLSKGLFSDADDFHRVSGEVRVMSINGEKYLRFENFSATNGPDLKVYLSSDRLASGYASLGELKGNIGSQNYPISSDINLGDYPYVLIWCEKFSVLFGYSKLG